MSNGKLRILITNNFRAGTDGGGLNVYPHIERGLKQLLIDQIASGVVNELEVAPEDDVPTAHDTQQQLEAEAQTSEQLGATHTVAEQVPSSVEETNIAKKTKKVRRSERATATTMLLIRREHDCETGLPHPFPRVSPGASYCTPPTKRIASNAADVYRRPVLCTACVHVPVVGRRSIHRNTSKKICGKTGLKRCRKSK
jgi:hypothetical protein